MPRRRGPRQAYSITHDALEVEERVDMKPYRFLMAKHSRRAAVFAIILT